MLKLSGRSSNLLRSVYELHRWARTRWVLQNFEPAQNFCRPFRPVIRRSDNVLKTRWTYYKRNCRTSILLETCYDVVQSDINCQYVCKPTHLFVARLPHSQTGLTRLCCVLSTLLFRPNAFKTKAQVLNKLATRFYTVLKVLNRFLVRFTRL